jgi:hypothetical protein
MEFLAPRFSEGLANLRTVWGLRFAPCSRTLRGLSTHAVGLWAGGQQPREGPEVAGCAGDLSLELLGSQTSPLEGPEERSNWLALAEVQDERCHHWPRCRTTLA